MQWWNRVIRADFQLLKLEEWIKKQGYQLVKGTNLADCIDNKKKLICLNTRSKIEHQLYSLLHECGHLHTRKDKRKFTDKFKTLVNLEEKEHKRKPLLFYMQEIEDEVSAWRAGEKLAKKLKISLSSNLYYKYASRFIFGYMTFAVASRKSRHR